MMVVLFIHTPFVTIFDHLYQAQIVAPLMLAAQCHCYPLDSFSYITGENCSSNLVTLSLNKPRLLYFTKGSFAVMS